MKPKPIITAVLLLFVAISVVALIVKQSSDAPVAGAGEDTTVADNKLPDDRLIVYYFHGNMRCPTCMTLEEYSKEAVETLFADKLNAGRVEFQVVNYDETWNEHFLNDYDLSFQSLVLVEIKNGKEVGYKNLIDIWDLVDDKKAYFEYVKTEVNAFQS